MKNITIVAILLVVFIGLTNCFPIEKSDQTKNNTNLETPASTNFPGYQPFPVGYGYFEEIEKLKLAVNNQNRSYIRDHGWKLFAGLMQPAKGMNWPVWYTWPTGTQAFHIPTKERTATHSLIATNKKNQPLKNMFFDEVINGPILDDVPTPIYPIPNEVVKRFPDAISNLSSFNYKGKTYQTGGIKSGNHFRSNGDIMTATEALSQESFSWIREDSLYLKETLRKDSASYKNNTGPHSLNAAPKWISTKHMYWPVLKDQLGVLPVWNNDFGPEFRGYAGYENWKELVAIDPSNARGGETETVSFLHNVFSNDTIPLKTRTQESVIHNIDNFYHHQITPADTLQWSDGDKASLMAASYWAYNKPIGVGDYIVTIATHINTKEVPTWALQSAWWSNTPNQGKHSKDRPHLPQAKGPWGNYKLTTAYGLPDTKNKLEISFNPYIELVIHPVATNCNNCHVRAGFPSGPNLTLDVASYQNKGCEDLLSFLNPNTAPCLSDHLLTDYIWLISGLAN